MPPRREWRHYLVLAEDPGVFGENAHGTDMFLKSWNVDTTEGAIILCRDVLSAPPAYYAPHPTDPDNLPGILTQPVRWRDGTVSETPPFGRAVASFFGKRSRTPGSLGARVHFASIRNWATDIPTCVANIALSVDGRVWKQPEVVLVLRNSTGPISRLVVNAWPLATIAWVPGRTPQACAAAIGQIRSARNP